MDTALNPFDTLPGKPPRDADRKLRMVSNVIALFWLIASILLLLDIPEYLEELRQSSSPLETGMQQLGTLFIMLWYSGSAYLSGRRKRLGYPGLGFSTFSSLIMSIIILYFCLFVIPVEVSVSGIYSIVILLSMPLLTILHLYLLIKLYKLSHGFEQPLADKFE